MATKKIKYLDIFSGIGGFPLGIQQAYEEKNKSLGWLQQKNKERWNSRSIKSTWNKCNKWECIGYSEIDKYAIQIYEKHFNHKAYGDITKINVQKLQDFDLIVGGFPCQSFSIAGKRGGFEDTRGTLFFEIARIVKTKRPRLLLLENVKGLLSHDEGNTFATIISTLDELGYDCQWQVLNSKNFGVPQNRERVFIIGHLRGTPRPKVFPIGEGNKNIIEERKRKLAGTLTASAYKGANSNGMTLIQLKGGSQGERIYSDKGISTTIASQAGGQGAKTGLYAILNKKGKQKPKTIASTLTGGGHSGGNHSDMDLLLKDTKIRRLTPKECERLQGFPDDWTKLGYKNGNLLEYKPIYDWVFQPTEGGDFEEVWRIVAKEKLKVPIKDAVFMSDTQRYKTLGNAVTVNVIKEIIKKLL